MSNPGRRFIDNCLFGMVMAIAAGCAAVGINAANAEDKPAAVDGLLRGEALAVAVKERCKDGCAVMSGKDIKKLEIELREMLQALEEQSRLAGAESCRMHWEPRMRNPNITYH